MEVAARMAAEVAREVAAPTPEDEAPPPPPTPVVVPAQEEEAEEAEDQPLENAPNGQHAQPQTATPKKRKKSLPLNLDDRQRRELAQYVEGNAILYDHSVKGWNKPELRDPIWEWWAQKEELDRRHHSSTQH